MTIKWRELLLTILLTLFLFFVFSPNESQISGYEQEEDRKFQNLVDTLKGLIGTEMLTKNAH